jgi:hypothetical protein
LSYHVADVLAAEPTLLSQFAASRPDGLTTPAEKEVVFAFEIQPMLVPSLSW